MALKLNPELKSGQAFWMVIGEESVLAADGDIFTLTSNGNILLEEVALKFDYGDVWE